MYRHQNANVPTKKSILIAGLISTEAMRTHSSSGVVAV